MLPPFPLVAQVLTQDPENDSVTVVLQSGGQFPTAPIKMLYHGHADGMRINKKPLPGKGTWGLVMFANGDIRNGVWLGGYHSSLIDAIPNNASDPFVHYDAHFSGHWNHLDTYGNYAQQWADGSTLVVNASGAALPTIYRHTVDQTQVQQRVKYPYKDRVSAPPKPFAMAFTQAVSGGNGGCAFSVDASGNSTLSSSVTGKTSTITYNGASIKIDATGNIQMTPAGGAYVVVNGELHATGNIIAGYGGGSSVTLLNHTHGGVTTGSGHTVKPDGGT